MLAPVLAVAIASCSSTGSSPGTGGSTSSGGSTGLGGSTGKGGATANGGSNGSGGAAGASGGTTSSGGAISSGGTTSGSQATGGNTSSGGSTTAGGTTSAGGSSAVGGSTNAGGNSAKGGATSGGGTTGAGGGTAGSSGAVTVQLDKTKQTIDGFGINDTWGSVLSDAQAKAMFDQSTGLGLSILRVGMSWNGGFYNGDEASRITLAKKYGATKIIGSVWSPPKECKTNNSTINGGHLKETCYGSWSDSIAKFAKDNSLYAMSAGNEPDYASCHASKGPPCNDADYDTTEFTAKEMVAFVKVLGPKLKAANVKLITPEASEWIHTWSNLSVSNSTVAGKPNSSDPLNCGCFKTTATGAITGTCASTCLEGNGYDYGHWLHKDSDAWGFVDILGVHQYDSQVAEPWPADVNGGKPDKAIWQTEMSGVMYWPEAGPSTTIENGVAVAGWLHNALTVGEANAWVWWWYNGTSTNEGLYNNNNDTKRHYTYGNFTKFIRPGYVRVDVAGSIPTNVLLSAYKGTDGTVVVVAINKGTAAATVPIAIAGGTAPASCTPNVTSSSANLTSGTAVTVTGGTLTASLAGTTVTTFVCK
jgi:glucuronoarabinoxylan endo-1,4-beta-xylanase